MVPAGPARRVRQPVARLLRLERHLRPLSRGAGHLRGLRDVQLDLGRRGGRLLLAPVLLAPTRPELRQHRGAHGHVAGRGPVARDGRRRGATRRRALSVRARGHQLREPARDPRLPQGAASSRRRQLPRTDAVGRGQPVARGQLGLLRRWRRVPHCVPLPLDATPVHVAAHGGSLPRRRHPATDARHPRRLPVGDLPAQPRRADPRDGDRRRARLHVPRLRRRPADARQRRHPATARAAHAERSPQDRADERSALRPARYARHLLRRRAGHGRQRLPGRSRRRAHADAVEP